VLSQYRHDEGERPLGRSALQHGGAANLTLSLAGVRRLFPSPGEVEVADLLEDFPPAGPYLALNMVASVDGRAVLKGRTSGLGGEADHALFHGLRERVDCVMAGAGTVRAEGYGRLIKDPDARARRASQGLNAEPVTAVVSRSGDVPLEGAVVGDDPAELIDRLRAEYGVRSILCEGGPTLNEALFRGGLVDELFLTVSPQLVGGVAPLTILNGTELDPPPQLGLVSLAEGGGDLLFRWRL
jgi:riboflavin biosynthesis pyrimidine reductase